MTTARGQQNRTRDLLLELRGAIAAAPIRSWDADEIRLVLAAVQQVIEARQTNVVTLARTRTPRRAGQ